MEIGKPTIILASKQSARSEIAEGDGFKKSQRHQVLDASARNFPACGRNYESVTYQLAGKGIRSARKIRQRLLQSVPITAAALINLTSAATIKGGFAQSPLLVSRSDVNMAILKLQLVRASRNFFFFYIFELEIYYCFQIGVVIFLISALEAQNSNVTTSDTASSVSTASSITGESSGSATPAPESVLNDGSPGSSNNPTKPDAADNGETADNGSLENGGYPFVKPGKHRPGLRHVKAHDGFHSLKAEKKWAHWNDAFTTSHP